MKTLQTIKEKSYHDLDFRELVNIKASREAAHKGGERLTPKEHYENFKINSALIHPPPLKIVVFDDVITTGASFKGIKKILENYSSAKIIGIFIARVKR